MRRKKMGYFRDNVERADGYVPGFQPKAMDVVKLNTNENPYPPSPQVMKALAGMKPEQLRRYPDPLGNAFRETAAEINGVKPENIMCCNGGDDLLSIAIRACCDEQRPLAYPVPTYTLYPVLARLHNCPTIEVAFDEEFNLPAKLARCEIDLEVQLHVVDADAVRLGTGVGVHRLVVRERGRRVGGAGGQQRERGWNSAGEHRRAASRRK